MSPSTLSIPLVILLCAPLAAQAPLYDHNGNPAGSHMAAAVAPMGDVNGDGAGDYALGAPRANGLEPNSGAVYLRSGKEAGTVWIFQGEREDDLCGFSVAALGDIDGDGVSDLIVGAPRAEYNQIGIDRGVVYVLSGASGALIQKLGGTADFDQLGYSVAGVGDMDGDGVPDYAFGVPYDDLGSQVDLGSVWIYAGATHTPIWHLFGEVAGSRFAYALGTAGDIDGDGRGDLLVGAPGYDLGSPPFLLPEIGKAYLYSGKSATLLHSEIGGFPFDNLGASVAGGVDLNGDGRLDFAVGVPYSDASFTNAGQVRVRSGVPPYSVLYTVEGVSAGDELGYALDLALDADGDGLGDLLIGAPGVDIATLSDAGKAYVHNGASGALRYEIGGRFTGDRMGMEVSTLGFVNADPWTDFLGGAPFGDHATIGVDAGWGRVHLGNAQPILSYCTAKTNSAGCVPFISYAGCPSLSVGSLTLGAVNVLENKSGFLMWSLAQNALPFNGGTLCLKAPIKRTPLQTSTSSGSPCGGTYNFAFTQAYMAAHGLSAGQDVFAQFWSRDSGFPHPNSIGLTNGLHVTILP